MPSAVAADTAPATPSLAASPRTDPVLADPAAALGAGQPISAAQASQLALELFVAGYEGETLPDYMHDYLQRGLAGVILFRRNLRFAGDQLDVDALCAQTASVHRAGAAQHTQLPVVCSVDQEGGAVQRLKSPFTVFPPMRTLAASGDLHLLRRVGQQLGRELLAAGFNLNYAPVLDVDTNPDNPIIGNRSFSRNAHEVASYAGALLAGMQAEGVLGCGKHFPGHGDTDADSHLALPVLRHDLARLKAVELVPFAALSHQLPMVMTAHVLFEALDPDRPATVSPAILRPLLRDWCGFDGVIVSDDLEMAGIASVLDPGACVVQGLTAGCDLFLACRQRAVLDAALAAATAVFAGQHGTELQLAASKSVARVRRLRRALPAVAPSAAAVQAVLADATTASLRAAISAA